MRDSLPSPRGGVRRTRPRERASLCQLREDTARDRAGTAVTDDPLFWIGFWAVVIGITLGLAYLESNDKGDR